MRVQRIDIKMKARLPRIRTSWPCLLAALFVVALGGPAGRAQDLCAGVIGTDGDGLRE